MTLERLAPWARAIALSTVAAGAIIGGAVVAAVVEIVIAYGRRPS